MITQNIIHNSVVGHVNGICFLLDWEFSTWSWKCTDSPAYCGQLSWLV